MDRHKRFPSALVLTQLPLCLGLVHVGTRRWGQNSLPAPAPTQLEATTWPQSLALARPLLHSPLELKIEVRSPAPASLRPAPPTSAFEARLCLLIGRHVVPEPGTPPSAPPTPSRPRPLQALCAFIGRPRTLGPAHLVAPPTHGGPPLPPPPQLQAGNRVLLCAALTLCQLPSRQEFGDWGFRLDLEIAKCPPLPCSAQTQHPLASNNDTNATSSQRRIL